MPQTVNYNLPTFGASDAVNLLTTYNQAMATIDSTMKSNYEYIVATDNKLVSIVTRVGTLETTVGNSTSGLVKRVTDLESTVSSHTTTISTLSSDVDALELTVGDNSSGLVKAVADLDTRIDNLEGVEFDPQPSTDAQFDVTKLANAHIDKNGIVYFVVSS